MEVRKDQKIYMKEKNGKAYESQKKEWKTSYRSIEIHENQKKSGKHECQRSKKVFGTYKSEENYI